jgi:predicted nucleic acid-binding protein
MPDEGLVVADTSPLLNLALIDHLDLLETQFSGVTVPE